MFILGIIKSHSVSRVADDVTFSHGFEVS